MRTYPETRRDDVVETLHGHRIADPYRWLEDPDAEDTRAWVERQRAFTEAALAELPARAWFQTTMAQIMARPRHGVLDHEAGWWFITRNDGHQAQNVLVVAATLEELEAGGRVLLDPNTWSSDGTTSLHSWSIAPDGRLLAYGVSEGGSDWVRYRLLDIATGADVDDVEVLTKFSWPVWLPDSSGYLIHRYDEVGTAEGTDTMALRPSALVVHRLGEPLADAEVVVPADEEPMRFTAGRFLPGDRWLVLTTSIGTERGNSVALAPVESVDGHLHIGEFVDVVADRTHLWQPLAILDDALLCQTDAGAPHGRVVRLPLGGGDAVDVIAASDDILDDVILTASGLVTVHLRDCSPVVTRWSLTGELRGEVPLTAGGVLVHGHHDDDLVSVWSSDVATVCRQQLLRFSTGELRTVDVGVVDTFIGPEVTMQRLRATSADGTQVPYFLLAPAGGDLSVPAPTLVYGYGGFSVPVAAGYGPGWAGWLAAGGRLAIANLRGGSEFGRAWYDGGRRENKQHVFDDVIAVGEDLVARGLSTPAQLAIHGRSNGGLLVGAAMTQRPDLWAVALPAVGVLDVLRFHLFTGGRAWISDYGDPDDPHDFEVALAYSPLHNIVEGTHYPATLVATGDHDDRVVPLHSHKFTAALQHAQGGDAPILTRIETSTGHGMGKPAAMVGAEWADLLAFAAHHTGLVVPNA